MSDETAANSTRARDVRLDSGEEEKKTMTSHPSKPRAAIPATFGRRKVPSEPETGHPKPVWPLGPARSGNSVAGVLSRCVSDPPPLTRAAEQQRTAVLESGIVRFSPACAGLLLEFRAEGWAVFAWLVAMIGGCDQRAAPGSRLAELGKAHPQQVTERIVVRTLGGSAEKPGFGRPVPGAPSAKLESVCPKDMLEISGQYCRVVSHRCLEWMDPPGKFRRCKLYEQPARCTGARKHMHFCIDRDEFKRDGSTLALSNKSFFQASRICQEAGKRICSESEWNFACEGEELRPYPYGFERDPTACNADRLDLAAGAHQLRDLRAPRGAYPRCTSPFGVRDLTGNLEELVAREDYRRRPALKGGHFLPGRNHCRARQIIHGPGYSGVETGFRCCADPIVAGG
jgi:Sulfatase-modifying factor enzyme 1